MYRRIRDVIGMPYREESIETSQFRLYKRENVLHPYILNRNGEKNLSKKHRQINVAYMQDKDLKLDCVNEYQWLSAISSKKKRQCLSS